ncbi:MAG: V-type ATP synthase subunit I [bacterium]
MAIDQVSKVVIAVHARVKDEFLCRLQRLGVFHITRTTEAETVEQDKTLSQLLTTIELLTVSAVKKKDARVVLAREQYEEIARSYDLQENLVKVERLTVRRGELENRLKILSDEIKRLKPWTKLEYKPTDLTKLAGVKVILGRFAERAGYENVRAAIAAKPAAIQILGEEENHIYAAIAVAVEYADEVGAILAGERWENIELKGLTVRPAEAILQLEQEERQINQEIGQIQEEIQRLTAELPKLKVMADALLNKEKRKEVEVQIVRTDSSLLIYGWVRDRDLRKVKQLIDEFGVAVLARVEPEPDEQPPVALVNRRLWRPFELVLELYQLPLPDELDPTWLIAPFFGIFFALCLTDAGYGIVLTILAISLMRRMGASNKLLGIVLISAILTIPAGAMVGGWFGDIFDRLGIGWLAQFKNRLMWFDPMKEPMKFFILSIALGYCQLVAGIGFEIADCLRLRRFGDGLLGQLPWFVLLNCLVLRLILSRWLSEPMKALLLILVMFAVAAIVVFNRRERRTMVSQWFWFGLLGSLLVFLGTRLGWLPPEFGYARWVVLAVFLVMTGYAGFLNFQHRGWTPLRLGLGIATVVGLLFYFLKIIPAFIPGIVGTVFYFISPNGQRLVKKLVWGGYALYGATSYIGVLLSYIRLMALGMCTGGVAMAINVIAWMVMPIPVIGILLGLIVLVVGHTYNIAVNVLGAFVHSLRLQYVEFFPRFYSGGGEPFQPFKEINQFVSLKS